MDVRTKVSWSDDVVWSHLGFVFEVALRLLCDPEQKQLNAPESLGLIQSKYCRHHRCSPFVRL
jgi:hypothetical protein